MDVDASTGPSRAGAVRAWAGFVLLLVASVYRTMLFMLLAVALLPTLWHWSSYVVRSGSMEPSLAVGDVVVASPFGQDEVVPVGRVMVFTNPDSSQGREILVHRVVENLGHGEYVTAGDANASNDTAPVPAGNFRARGLICAPWVGLPLVWLADGNLTALALWLAVTTLLVYLSFRRVDGGSDQGQSSRPRSGRGPRRPRRRRTARPATRPRQATLAFTVVTGALGLAVTLPVSASATFTDTTVNHDNRWSTDLRLLQPYPAAVLADHPYAFYRVEESGGANATDFSGNGRTGTFASVGSYRLPGALPGNPGYAVGLAGGGGRLVSGGSALADPNTFTIELWFKTTTNSGGKLLGFESTRNATSALYDRQVFMQTDGRIAYGSGTGSGARSLVSPSPVNDGAWHQVVVTARPHGSQHDTSLYLDGALVASGTTNRSSSFSGWWRAGYGSLPTTSGYPASANFSGAIDEFAIYQTELTAARVAAHYAAR